jgi:hypothetical protein
MSIRDFRRHIFTNFPFDRKYLTKLQALIFVIIDCGYWPCCSLEYEGDERTRHERLQAMAGNCQYGIHDLSRVTVKNGCPRFNMPYETGLHHGSILYGKKRSPRRAMLIMDSVPYRFQKTTSDLAGMDIKIHGDQPNGVIRVVRNWLRAVTQDPLLPAAPQVQARFRKFLKALPGLMRIAGFPPSKPLGLECYSDYVEFARAWIAANGHKRRKV